MKKLKDYAPVFKLKQAHLRRVEGNSMQSNYIKNTLRTLLYGLNWLSWNKYKVWFFSSSLNLSLIDGILYDTVTSSFIDKVDDGLLIIRPVGLFDKKKLWTKKYTSESILIIIVMMMKMILSVFISNPFRNDIIDKEYTKNYKSIYTRFLAEYYVFSFFIKIFNIKKAYFVCSYSYFGYIYACKKNEVKVVEIQHGLINDNHPGYIYKEEINKKLFPDELFVNGSRFKEVILNSSTIYNPEQIKIIGSNALHIYANNKYKEDCQIKELRKYYEKIVLFTGQYTTDLKALKIIEEVQKRNQKCCFLFLTRRVEELNKYKRDFKDVVFYKGNQKFYDLVKQVDYHATVYSTTFLESLYYGVPNILFDIEDYPQNNYKEILDKEHSWILCASNPHEITSFIFNRRKISKKEITKSVSSFFCNDFEQNLKHIQNEVT